MVVSSWADVFQESNAAFAKGDYPAAIRSLETALLSLGPSAELYYNLGMAQAKDGQQPQAVLSLRRALVLNPQMIDAQMALSELERSQGIPVEKPHWRKFVAEHLPLNALLIIGTALIWMGAFLALGSIFTKNRKFSSFIWILILLVLGSIFIAVNFFADPRILERRTAIVLAKDGVTLLAAPADQSAVIARLPAATHLQVLRRNGDWAYCQIPTGQLGWTSSKALELLVASD